MAPESKRLLPFCNLAFYFRIIPVPLDTSHIHTHTHKTPISTFLSTTCPALTLQGNAGSPGVNYLLVSGSPLHKQRCAPHQGPVPQL